MRRLGVCRALTVVSLLLPALGLASVPAQAGSPAAAPQARRCPRAPAADTGLEISLSSVSPAIARPGQDVTVAGTVTNRGSSAVPRPVARVVLGSQPLAVREDVDRWAAASGPAQGREVGRSSLGASIAPGDTAAFRVQVKDAAGLRQPTYGALPLSVEVGDTSLRTFAGYQRLKQYQPLRLGWVVPLTLDPEPALFGAEGDGRDAAWEKALGSGSRLSRVVEATESAPVTWAIDPSLLPSLLPSQTGQPAPSGTDAETSPEAALRSAAEERIRSSTAQHSPWVLPDTDADVAAVADAGASTGLVPELVSRSAAVARAVDGRADVAWPVDGRHTPAREAALRRLYTQPRLGAQLAAQSTLPLGGNTQDAHRRSADGLPVLAYDDRLSALLGADRQQRRRRAQHPALHRRHRGPARRASRHVVAVGAGGRSPVVQPRPHRRGRVLRGRRLHPLARAGGHRHAAGRRQAGCAHAQAGGHEANDPHPVREHPAGRPLRRTPLPCSRADGCWPWSRACARCAASR